MIVEKSNNSFPTGAPSHLSKAQAKKDLKAYRDQIGELQNLMYAQGRFSLLIVLQGMDAAGKDGAIKNVFRKVSPSGIAVKSFKKPTDEEMNHDFLWRVHNACPEKGMIKIFNRSHYEDVLIQRVHRWIDEETLHKRFNHINNFETLLQDQNTIVLKFFLSISKDKQLEKLEERKANPVKFWKHNQNDFVEREHWSAYMKAYEDAIANCSSVFPWHVVPSDENWYKEYLIAKTVMETLSGLDMQFPVIQ